MCVQILYLSYFVEKFFLLNYQKNVDNIRLLQYNTNKSSKLSNKGEQYIAVCKIEDIKNTVDNTTELIIRENLNWRYVWNDLII